jgi:hypothetical protein
MRSMTAEPFTTVPQLRSKSSRSIDYQLELEEHGFGIEFAMILT